MKPLAIDLFCGLGGWAEGFLAEGYDVIGFDIERRPYPGSLVLQDVLTIHGSQFRNAAVIVASPPCQAYSYRAMPWKRAKALPPPSNELFDACFCIQREAIQATGQNHTCRECGGEGMTSGCCRCEFCDGKGFRWYPARQCENCGGSGVYQRRVAYSEVVDEQCEYCEGWGVTNYRYIPMVVENVKGAQPWVGRARWHYGSFYLWGDVPALMPFTGSAQKFNPDGTSHGQGSWFAIADSKNRGTGKKNDGGSWFNIAHNTESGVGQNPDGRKNGKDWFGSGENCSLQRRQSSKSNARKAASAQIAKIPFELARHIAEVFKPQVQARAAG